MAVFEYGYLHLRNMVFYDKRSSYTNTGTCILAREYRGVSTKEIFSNGFIVKSDVDFVTKIINLNNNDS